VKKVPNNQLYPNGSELNKRKENCKTFLPEAIMVLECREDHLVTVLLLVGSMMQL